MVPRRSSKMIYLFVLVMLGSLAMAPYAQAALAARGPINPDNGFPVWYQDAGGLALSLCADPTDLNCLADPVDQNNPISVAVGFGDEAFWWDTETAITLPAGTPVVGAGQALIVMAMEAAWITGSPAEGQQQAFGRMRIRIDLGVPGTYTVDHPFGTSVFEVPQTRIDATGGIRAIDDADVGPVGVPGADGLTLVSTTAPLADIGCEVAPCDFDLALTSGVGPFLRWDPAVPPAAPVGYLGNPAAAHEITGGVSDVFTVTGPANAFGLGVNSVTTDEFSVSGKIFNIVPAAGDSFWTWYDSNSPGFRNWVMMGNPADNLGNFNFSLSIAGVPKTLPGSGLVSPGNVTAAMLPGTFGGPVKLTELNGGRAVTSQRTLLGNSLDEVVGQEFERLSNQFVWTWYDNVSPGFRNWVMITNPDPLNSVFWRLFVGGTLAAEDTLAAGTTVAPLIEGLMGGPVEVQAFTDGGMTTAADVMASQRVLSNNGMAINEEPGIPDGTLVNEVSDNYNWPWYDMASPGATNWVMVANAEDAGDVFYDVIINGLTVADNIGPVGPNDTDTQLFPGTIGGPVQVSCFSDAAGTVTTDCVASQRVIWGPSFEETYGRDDSDLATTYHWTWYDMLTVGAQNWVMVSNPPAAAGGAGVAIDYQIFIGGLLVDNNTLGPIPINGEVTMTFAGTRDGPVEVRTFNTGTLTPANSVASQRVIWGGTHFNEVMGTALLPPIVP